MKALKYLLYITLGIAALWLTLCLFAKPSYHIERSVEIEAPRETVFEQVQLFKNFTNWSPWHFMDPKMKIAIEGPDGMPGTVYRWESELENVGKGTQKITAVTPTRIDYEVDFGLGASPVYFKIEGDSQLTQVLWAMDMKLPFLYRAGGMFTDLNAFVGKDYENGLAHLRRYCEALNPKTYGGFKVLVGDRAPSNYAVVRKEVDFQDISTFLGESFGTLLAAIGVQDSTLRGYPSGFVWSYDTVAMKTDMAAAVPVLPKQKIEKGMELVTIGGEAIFINFFGNYAGTQVAHEAIDEYMLEKNLEAILPIVEEYVTDPSLEPDTAKWLTRVLYFVREKPDSTAVEEN